MMFVDAGSCASNIKKNRLPIGGGGGKPHIAPPPRKALWAWLLMVLQLLRFTPKEVLFCSRVASIPADAAPEAGFSVRPS
jgi:hypothetical protein